jgi:hypothetical protein
MSKHTSLLKFLGVIGTYLVLLNSCSNNNSETQSQRKSKSGDSLFILSNIKSSLIKIDSATYKKFISIDTIQKSQFVTPEIVDENPDVTIVGQTYINEYVSGLFISKQDKIGDNQPIIISARGDDYDALILIILDRNNKPLSHILLSGGLEGGPDGELGDSIVLLHQRESIIKNDEILTYVLRIRQPEDDTNKLPTIDSISYLRKIMPDGTIKILKTDSIRYYRKVIKWPNHYW